MSKPKEILEFGEKMQKICLLLHDAYIYIRQTEVDMGLTARGLEAGAKPLPYRDEWLKRVEELDLEV